LYLVDRVDAQLTLTMLRRPGGDGCESEGEQEEEERHEGGCASPMKNHDGVKRRFN
jgi:hypothetical protein